MTDTAREDAGCYPPGMDRETVALQAIVLRSIVESVMNRRDELRVRLLTAGLARRIDALPGDVSTASRRRRITWICKRGREGADQLGWGRCYGEARRRIEGVLALDDGAPLSLMFPVPSEGAVTP